MTQRTIHRAGLNGHGERERFEKWLLTPARGRMPADGSEYQQKIMRQNLERAAQAPFSIRARLRLMEEIFTTTDPEKSLAILRGLRTIAKSEKSCLARKLYERLSAEWVVDTRILAYQQTLWTDGFAFIHDLPAAQCRFSKLVEIGLVVVQHRRHVWDFAQSTSV